MKYAGSTILAAIALLAGACGGEDPGISNDDDGAGGAVTTGDAWRKISKRPGSTSSSSSSSTSSSSSSSSSSSTSSSSSSSSGTIGTGSGKWVSGYYVGYLHDMYPPESIDWNGLTHLMIGAVIPQADGSLDTTFTIDAVNGPLLAKQLVSLAHQHGKKAVVMLGGAGAYYNWVGAASSAHRATLVSNLVKLANDYGFDGFDLDWEPIQTTDQASFTALAQALRAALPATILTVPVAWTSSNFPTVDAFYGQIAPLFDQINIMSYSMAGSWGGWQSWHSGALSGQTSTKPTSVDVSVQSYLAAGVPAAKLGIGIGFYGSCWSSPVNGPGQALGSSTIVADDNVMTFDHIMSAYYSTASYHWDAAAHVPYLGFSSPHGPEGCTFVSYENEQSIADKGQYVRDKGLGGAIVWTINEGYRPSQPAGQQDPLMEALGKAFLQ